MTLTVVALGACSPGPTGAPAATPPPASQATRAVEPAAEVATARRASTARAASFDRAEFLAAMERLHEYYRSPQGLQRPAGLALGGGPDFLGIAAWMFDIYLTCRGSGRAPEAAWTEVVASITQTDEWKSKHPGQPSTTPAGCAWSVTLDRQEFLRAMERLDAYYRAPAGLQRADGLSIGGAPDFLGIAAWIFDVYLNARLSGVPADASWIAVVRAIQQTGEWQSKHPEGAAVRFAVIGDFGIAGPAARDVADRVKSWNVDLIITTGDNNYPNGAAATIDGNIGRYYADFIFPYSGGFSSAATANRFFPTLGNHDWEAPGAQPYLSYFSLPGNERYYDLVRGPVHLFALDSDAMEPDGITAGSVQGQWLRARLAASASPYRIVYLHHAPYSSGLNGSTPALQWPYRAWGASVVIAGHDHNYERILHDGLPFIVNGSGGYGLYAFRSPVAGSVLRYNGDHGAMLVEADASGVLMQFITRAGVVIDTFRLPPP